MTRDSIWPVSNEYRGTSLIRLYRSQAKVQGQDVTWLVPYEFGQNLPEATLNPKP